MQFFCCVFMNLLLSNINNFVYNFPQQTTQLKNKTLYLFVYLFMAILLCELKRMFNLVLEQHCIIYFACTIIFYWIVKFEWIMGVCLWLWQKELLLLFVFKCRRGWDIIVLCSQLIEWNNQCLKLSIVRVSSVQSFFLLFSNQRQSWEKFNRNNTTTEYTNQCMHNILCKCLFDLANDLYIKPEWTILNLDSKSRLWSLKGSIKNNS